MNKPIPWRRCLGELLIALVLAGILIVLAVPNYVSPPRRRTSPLNACINNLRQLDGAAEQWRLENNRATNDTPTMAEANIYLKSLPVCLSGGTYTYETNTGSPVCSIREHLLR